VSATIELGLVLQALVGDWRDYSSERLKMKQIHRNWDSIVWASAIVALGCIAATQRPARAQNPDAGWAAQNYKIEKSTVVQFPQKATVLREGAFANAQQEQTFGDYYRQYLFPLITREDNRQSPTDVIAKLRVDLRSCETRDQQQVFTTLTDLTLAYMTNIAKDSQYHPVARVNAMLTIGEVNSPKAVDVLLAAVFDRNQIDAVRVAALSGLIHLAGQSAMTSPQVAGPVIVRMAAFIGRPVQKSARAEGIAWMHGQAADVLAALKSPGSQNEVPPALLSMLSEKTLPIPLRSKAARALGMLNYGGSPPAADAYVTALAEFARDALSSDQPADRGRVELVARDVETGLKPFAAAALGTKQALLLDGLKKTLTALDKETLSAPPPEDLKSATEKAKESLDRLLK
jgi:hypothetical protein